MNEKRTHVLKQGDLLTGREAAARLQDVSYAKLMRWARERKVPYVENLAGRKMFRVEDIEALNTYTFVPARDDDPLLPEDRVLPGFSVSGGESGEC
ncbi:hypothetical protein [Gleimia europaea]|uniref:Uncharacterized protein n=1 Tax=Gleimia europaea ACS-120-V-Col10b TaxID=883069 RepID=A0A9W5RFK4_9ACTO|nr:hypothetical protein [Gleimia europaea]EPD31482.1 hypothetical protein HMPREF9238_01258 [Gleimia europaea ACS-120-V-Col10b]